VHTEARSPYRVLLQTEPALLDPSLEVLEELARDPSSAYAFLIYPRLPLSRLAFERFAARVRETDAARHPIGAAPFVFAVFHPDAEPDLSVAERLVPFLRRTPDPVVQVLRASVLEGLGDGASQGTHYVDPENLTCTPEPSPESVREQVAPANLARVVRVGVDEVRRRIDDIREDRDRTYGALRAQGAA
jgi:hypothetical protein